MTITYHDNIIQGSDEWHALRCGMLTASEMKYIVTLPKVETRIKKNGEPYKQREPTDADNAATRAHLYELLGQRITGYVEPQYISDDMLRGHEDEIEARIRYDKEYASVQEIGFITNNEWGFTIGYSPDGLVGDDGQVEAKSRMQKYQFSTIIECAENQTIPSDFLLQVQTGLLVTRRKWCDFISYCGGAGMLTIRVFPDPELQDAIIYAATAFEQRIAEKMEKYLSIVKSKNVRLLKTERKIEQEMHL